MCLFELFGWIYLSFLMARRYICSLTLTLHVICDCQWYSRVFVLCCEIYLFVLCIYCAVIKLSNFDFFCEKPGNCVIFDFIKMDNYHVNHCLHLLGRNCSEYSLFWLVNLLPGYRTLLYISLFRDSRYIWNFSLKLF